MARQWKADDVLGMLRGYQAACILSAGVDLGVFEALDEGQRTAEDLAAKLNCDLRALRTLLDALAALELLEKTQASYRLAAGVGESLGRGGTGSVRAMAQHQGNCLRRWVQLAHIVRTGQPGAHTASIRGEDADKASFIEAMNDASGPNAPRVVADLGTLKFTHLLDVGGASGTWTLSFLRAHPDAAATIFDLPHVIPMAEARLKQAGFADRVKLVAGDFTRDPLPAGADLVWLGAIVHQQDRPANRRLFTAIFRALTAGGTILIRDMVMDEDRTRPVTGALFAINMLVATQTGGTFTRREFEEDLAAAGFADVRLLRQDAGMDAVIAARKPA